MDDPLRIAQRLFAIEDVYVQEMTANVHPDFDPLLAPSDPASAFGVQFRCAVDPDPKLLTPSGETSAQHRVLYSVNTGVRVLRPGVSLETQAPIDDDIVATINATFVVRYRGHDQSVPTKEIIDAFQENVVHHVWPYWREFVQGTAARLRVPPIVLPMRPAMQVPMQNVEE